MRSIDADELKTAFPCGEYVRTESVRATIDSMPTIEAEPVSHGHWIRKEHKGFEYFVCSECGDLTWNAKVSRYCFNCGCKMDLDEAEE